MMNTMDLFRLNDKVAVVTGGGRGIGRFIANGLAEAGADIVIASRKIENCRNAAEQIASLGKKTLAVSCDLEQPEQIDRLVERTLENFGRIDILVNNAGLTWGAPTLEYPIEKWEKVIHVNLRAVFLLSQKAATVMKSQGGGKIINITSILSFRGATEEMNPAVAYNAAKGGVNALTIDMAVKLIRYNIHVNAIAPGYFDTDLIAYAKQDNEYLKQFLAKIPAARLGKENDIKGCAVFLASAASDYLHGQIICADGGYLAA